MIFEWRLYFPWLKILFQFIADENRFIDSADFMSEMFGKRKRNLKNAIESLNEWIRRGGEREGGKEGDVGNTIFPQQMFIFNNKNECQKDNCRVLQGLKREKTQKTLTTYTVVFQTQDHRLHLWLESLKKIFLVNYCHLVTTWYNWYMRRAVGRFLVTGGGGEYPPPDNFKFGRRWNTVFTTCHEI